MNWLQNGSQTWGRSCNANQFEPQSRTLVNDDEHTFTKYLSFFSDRVVRIFNSTSTRCFCQTGMKKRHRQQLKSKININFSYYSQKSLVDYIDLKLITHNLGEYSVMSMDNMFCQALWLP